MLTTAKILGVIVGIGGVWGLVSTAISVFTMISYGAYDTLLQGAGGIIYIAQFTLGIVFNICAIALMIVLLTLPEQRNP